MLQLTPVQDVPFPSNTRAGRSLFWARYWFWFLVLLPWMLARQVVLSGRDLLSALVTWNRRFVLDRDLSLVFMNNLRSLAVTAVFGERFAAIQYRDTLIDPGPVFGRRRLRAHLDRDAGRVAAIIATHSHEEHIGSAAIAQDHTGAPVFGTEATLAAVAAPESLSTPRRFFIGQPAPTRSEHLIRLSEQVQTPGARLEVIESPGHCDGHASLFDRERGILFAGDSFLHEVFTCPNRDVSGDDWIETLEGYASLPVRTMVGTHGDVLSVDPAIAPRRFVVRRAAPLELIRDKATFLRWARDVVAEGERRGLPYSVIEACLFPWTRWWAWVTWFRDEGSRLFSAGEFSRTHFVRSLSKTPQRVPARFPPFARLVRWLRSAGGSPEVR